MAYKLERLQQAARLEKAGNWQKLLKYCQEWLTSEPSNFLACQGIGDALTQLDRVPEAIAAYRQGLEVAPAKPVELFGSKFSSGPLWYRLGNCYNTLGDYTSAIAALDKAAQIDPGEVDVWNNLGIAYLNANKPAEAIQAFKAGISTNPGNVQIIKNLGILYARWQMRDGVVVVHRTLSKIDHRAATEFLEYAETVLKD